MSTIATLFDKEVVIRRLKSVSGYRQAYQSTATIEANIQPVGQNERQGLPAVNTKDYVLYCDISCNIKSGDKLTVKFKDSFNYVRKTELFLVKSVEYMVANGGGGLVEHIEAQVEKLKSE